MIHSKYIWVARFYRVTPTQPGGSGTDVVNTETDIIPEIFCKWDSARSKEDFSDGTFSARDYPKIWFFWPGFGFLIKQGDRVAINYNDIDKILIVTGVIMPNSQQDPWCVECQEEVEGAAC